jgi:hypothetical protein
VGTVGLKAGFSTSKMQAKCMPICVCIIQQRWHQKQLPLFPPCWLSNVSVMRCVPKSLTICNLIRVIILQTGRFWCDPHLPAVCSIRSEWSPVADAKLEKIARSSHHSRWFKPKQGLWWVAYSGDNAPAVQCQW